MQAVVFLVLAVASVALAVALLLAMRQGRWLLKGLYWLGKPRSRVGRLPFQVRPVDYQWRGVFRLLMVLSASLWLFTSLVTESLFVAGCALLCFIALRYRRARALDTSQRIVSQLPNHLERMAMLLSAGLPLLTCLQQASQGASTDNMARELQRVVNQVKAGDSVHRAMVDFANRCPSREVRLFCAAVQHAQQSGSSLADILYAQAQQRRDELFLKAEQQAMEIPVRLMLPLMVFIFPATVMVLAVVLIGKLMWQL